METLLELAERCEQATGSDRELDAAIAAGVGLPHGKDSGWSNNENGDYWVVDECASAFTASLDAAMSLVPEGALWHVNKWANGADASIAFTRPYRDGPRYTAATPALALCAAALRAQAANPRRKEG